LVGTIYGCETWTLKKETTDRLAAFERWTYRRTLNISWIQHVTNDEIHRRIGTEQQLKRAIKRRKVSYFGPIMRNEKYALLQCILEGKIDGKRTRGRRRASWMSNIRNWLGKKQRRAKTHSQRQMEICHVDRQPHYLRRHLERERERDNTPSRSRVLRISKVRS
jgi:hypothetical protein